jgi:regulator of sigma E protease
MIMTILYYVLVVLALTVIILIHEIGHFIVARKAGMKVERFGIGMGPVIYKKTINDVEYCICAFPIGGFCQIKGEEEASTDTDSYDAKPPGKKFAVAAAGPLSNIILSFLILIITFSIFGIPVGKVQISKIEPKSPAAIVGLQSGDEITGVNNVISENWDVLRAEISKNPGKEIVLTLLRDGKELKIAVTPENVKGSGMLGIMLGQKIYNKRIGFFEAIKTAFIKIISFFRDFFVFLGMLVTGKLHKESVAGPWRIIIMAKDSISVGIGYFLFFMALLSLNLGFVNLFPVPPLDGGKIIFAGIEGIFKRKVNKNVEMVINTVGFVLLISLILFVTWNDINLSGTLQKIGIIFSKIFHK